MPRLALSDDEVERFREALCDVATRRFAEHGYDGVTMRALAAELGCSPMTPYRYFDNKAEIFAAVRSAAFSRFADGQEEAAASSPDHRSRLRALCRAYVQFALEEPAAYRIMFELDHMSGPPGEDDEGLRGWKVMYGVVSEACAAGVLQGDADLTAHLLWSGVHGLVALNLAGMLVLGRELEPLIDALLERELARTPYAKTLARTHQESDNSNGAAARSPEELS